jgi:hypothetical protein
VQTHILPLTQRLSYWWLLKGLQEFAITRLSDLFGVFMATGSIVLLRISSLFAPLLFNACRNPALANNLASLVIILHGIYIAQWRLSRGKQAEDLSILILNISALYCLLAAVAGVFFEWRHRTFPINDDLRLVVDIVDFASGILIPGALCITFWRVLDRWMSNHQGMEVISLPAPLQVCEEVNSVTTPEAVAV